MKKPTKKRLFLFSIITVVLVLAVLEIIFRIVFAVQYGGYHTSVYVQGNTLQVSDSLLVFKNRPFYLDYYKRYQFNQEGMRVNAGYVLMPQKGPNDYWVFLFGGSAMEGAGSNKDGEWLDITGVEDYTPDKTIAHYLQEYLQEKMPGKKVTVFNAANSGYSILQSMRRYQELSAKYQMDYVVSMDGENEPARLGPGQTVEAFVRQRWDSSALFRFPLKVIVPMTLHSAFLNKMKQASFHFRHEKRMKENIKNNFPARTYWLAAKAGQLKYADDDTAIGKAVDSFYAQFNAFDSLLKIRKQLHLLIVQPHLSLKSATWINDQELALFNYYKAKYNDPVQNSFKRKILQRFDKERAGSHPFNGWYLHWVYSTDNTFVDYCHLTEETNKYLGYDIGAFILNINPRY